MEQQEHGSGESIPALVVPSTMHEPRTLAVPAMDAAVPVEAVTGTVAAVGESEAPQILAAAEVVPQSVSQSKLKGSVPAPAIYHPADLEVAGESDVRHYSAEKSDQC
jgi:hypothetical protein